jgi:hypothetical protein
MQKISNLYILTESEMDEINYTLDLLYKYKAMAEINWMEEQAHEEVTEADI